MSALMTYRPLRPRGVPQEQAAIASHIGGGNFRDSHKVPPENHAELARLFADAVPYLWAEEMRQTARSAELPKHIVGRGQLPHPVMWWSWEVDVMQVDTADGRYTGLVSIGVLILDRPSGIEIIYVNREAGEGITEPATGALTITGSHIRYGASYPSEVVEASARQTLALLAFLNSPYISSDPVSTRPHNKSQARRLAEQPHPDVRVVQLRAAVSEQSDRGGSGDRVAWRVRWMVRGHYRAQWYPSTGDHWVIWVAPYLKGPKDAPFKPPIYAVTR